GSHKKLKTTATLAGIFAVSQIGIGAIVIDTRLHAVIVAIHNGVGILLFAMTLLTVLFAFRIARGQKIETNA
ncbi:MAG: COX15/CtaA family protein, partial [Nitrosotalea sp.]